MPLFDPQRIWMSVACLSHDPRGLGHVRSFHVTRYVWAFGCWWGEERKRGKNWDYGFIWDIFVLEFGSTCVCVCACVRACCVCFRPWTWLFILIFMNEWIQIFFFALSRRPACTLTVSDGVCVLLHCPGASASLRNLSYHFMKCLPLKWARKDKRLSLGVTRPR